REIERSGIPTLKVGFNSVFGYYLEVTHAQRERVPADYVRRQTLKNAERYVTPELKELEARVLSAEERSLRLEFELFERVRARARGRASCRSWPRCSPSSPRWPRWPRRRASTAGGGPSSRRRGGS